MKIMWQYGVSLCRRFQAEDHVERHQRPARRRGENERVCRISNQIPRIEEEEDRGQERSQRRNLHYFSLQEKRRFHSRHAHRR